RSRFGGQRDQAIDELRLRRIDLSARFVDGEPFAAVDLGVRHPAPGSARPLDARDVAGDRARVRVGFPRPGVYHLSGLLLDEAERNEWSRGDEARFFVELASSRVEKLFAFVDGAFRDRPRSRVALGPERPAGVREKDIDRALSTAKEKDSGAD